MREGVRSYSFFCTKKFLEKILKNGGMSGMSGMIVVFIDRISSRFIPFIPLRVRRARPFPFEKQKPTETPIGGLPL